jgi:glycine cleavage system H lipoate-binding protein
MSIEFAILILVLMLALFCFRWRQTSRAALLMHQDLPRTQPQTASGFDLPSGCCFHPGHTWMAEQEHATARVGIDSFAANLMGKLQNIAVIGEQRWVRQGQKLMTLTGDCETIEMLSPVEGVVSAINPEALNDPGVLLRDPYGDGWVCLIKSPEFESDQRNLMQGPMAARWMENSFKQLKSMLAAADAALAQDGGMPLPGSFNRLNPEGRKRVIESFF